MRPLWYSINVTLDGCCDHRETTADEDLHRHAVENLNRADALLFGRVSYELMESAFRSPARGAMPDWMELFARTIDAAKKYFVSSTLARVDWNAEPRARESGERRTQCSSSSRRREKDCSWEGVKLPAGAGAGGAGIDRRIRFRGAAQAGGTWTHFVRGPIAASRPEASKSAGVRLGGGGDAV